MAQYSIKLYYNTGFNMTNIPDSPALLEQCEGRTFDSNFLWQNQDIQEVVIKASWGDVANCDYVAVGSQYYYVVDVTMRNEQTAALTIQKDYITSNGGINSFEILDGWARRAHVSDDALFSNTAAEPFTPTSELIIDGIIPFTPKNSYHNFVASTVDLLATERIADEYVGENDATSVSVPRISKTAISTRLVIANPGETEANSIYDLPNQTLYEPLDGGDVYKGLESARSLGIEDSVTASYSIPEAYVTTIFHPPYSDEEISEIFCDLREVSVRAPFRYTVDNYTVRNNKVFALFNEMTYLSPLSGDSNTLNMNIIYNGETSPEFYVFGDPAPGGCPFCMPQVYKGETPYPLQNAIKGCQWKNNSIIYDTASGSAIAAVNFAKDQIAANLQAQIERHNAVYEAPGVLDVVASHANYWKRGLTGQTLPDTGSLRIGDALTADFWNKSRQADLNSYNIERNATDNEFSYLTEQNIIAPEIRFPVGTSMQNYYGNGFYFMRTRLSDNDVKRFDKFLTMFGYSLDEPLKREYFNNRRYFNYVRAEGIAVKSDSGLRNRIGIESQLSGGIRIWHVLPSPTYYDGVNPIVTTESEV